MDPLVGVKQRAPITMLGAHLHAFVLLYSSRLLISLYSPNGVRVQTNINGVQKPNALVNTHTHTHTRTHASAPLFLCFSAHRCRGNGACRSDPVWPTGTQYNARSTFARFCTFVLLRLLILLYSPNGVRIQTNTNGAQILEGNDIPGGTNEYKRSTPEYRRVQTNYKNLRKTTSQAVQTSTSGFPSVDRELETD